MIVSTIIGAIKIIFIDLVMSGDNAIIIALATKWLPKELRNKAMYAWVAWAAALRIWLASIAVYLLQYPIAKYVGWVMLMYVAWTFFRNLKLWKETKEIKAHWSLWSAIWVIILADVSLSLDNVLAVATIAENVWVLAWWLLASVAMMMFASQKIASLMDKYSWIQWIWLVVIVHAALWILLWSELWIDIVWIPIWILWLVVMCVVITYLYIRNVVHIAFHLRKHHLHNHVRLWIIFVVFFLFFISDFIPWVHEILHEYIVEWFSFVFLAYICLLELVMQQRSIDKHYMKHQSTH